MGKLLTAAYVYNSPQPVSFKTGVFTAMIFDMVRHSPLRDSVVGSALQKIAPTVSMGMAIGSTAQAGSLAVPALMFGAKLANNYIQSNQLGRLFFGRHDEFNSDLTAADYVTSQDPNRFTLKGMGDFLKSITGWGGVVEDLIDLKLSPVNNVTLQQYGSGDIYEKGFEPSWYNSWAYDRTDDKRYGYNGTEPDPSQLRARELLNGVQYGNVSNLAPELAGLQANQTVVDFHKMKQYSGMQPWQLDNMNISSDAVSRYMYQDQYPNLFVNRNSWSGATRLWASSLLEN